MLLIVEKGIRARLSHSINRDAKANNKYMIYFDKKRLFIAWLGNVTKIACKWI